MNVGFVVSDPFIDYSGADRALKKIHKEMPQIEYVVISYAFGDFREHLNNNKLFKILGSSKYTSPYEFIILHLPEERSIYYEDCQFRMVCNPSFVRIKIKPFTREELLVL